MESDIIDIFSTENELHINYLNDRKYDVKKVYELYWNDYQPFCTFSASS